ncbi:hypothetical protein [Paraburkholderia sp. SOS3]|uniref:hypothetical protein n=1 Tax=Paraburkholderia sp. SOS3 TaxID=1926494 RepID=UPI0009477ECB|nr:hypothetical protein [Paraburkholderia sp. SOS3]APR39589.1 hypothetical protein BTO02_30660 [Paraburkholderia sp. SOS3]
MSAASVPRTAQVVSPLAKRRAIDGRRSVQATQNALDHPVVPRTIHASLDDLRAIARFDCALDTRRRRAAKERDDRRTKFERWPVWPNNASDRA